MKNKFIKTLALLSACTIVAAPVATMLSVSAAQKTTTIEDKFDNVDAVGSYDASIWSAYVTDTNNSSIKVDEIMPSSRVMKFEGKDAGSSNGERVALGSKTKFTDIKSVKFDMKLPTGQSDWFAFDFVTVESPQNYVGDYAEEGNPMIYSSNFMISSSNFFRVGNWNSWVGSDSAADQWVTVEIVPTSATTASVNAAKRGKEMDASLAKTVELGENRSFQNCWMMMANYTASYHTDYLIDNVEIVDASGTYTEDFENSEIKNFDVFAIKDVAPPQTPEEDGVYEMKYSFPKVAGVNKMAIDDAKAGDRIILNQAIVDDDEYLNANDVVMESTFSIAFDNAAAETEEVAYVFGMAENKGNPFAGTWAYVMNKNGGKLVKYNDDGTEATLENNVNELTALVSDDGATINLTLRQNGALTVSENGEVVLEYAGVDAYDGYAGFAAVSDISSKIYLSGVSVANTVFDMITTKSVSHNFSNGYFGPEGNEDFVYLPEGGSIAAEEGELVFTRLCDGAYFGPSYRYDSFIWEFKMTSLFITNSTEQKTEATAPNRWIGFDFGRQTATSKMYGTYGMVMLRVTHPTQGNDDSRPLTSQWKEASVALHKNSSVSKMSGEVFTKVQPIPSSYFADISYDNLETKKSDIDAGAAVCFKIVGSGDRLDMYMKRADEGEYKLYVTIENINTSGYLAIMCTGYLYCTIDDFSVVNTSKVYNVADTVVPEGAGVVEEVVVYDRGAVDVNWQEEVTMNNLNAGSGSIGSGCGAVLGGASVAACAMIGVAAWIFSKRR